MTTNPCIERNLCQQKGPSKMDFTSTWIMYNERVCKRDAQILHIAVLRVFPWIWSEMYVRWKYDYSLASWIIVVALWPEKQGHQQAWISKQSQRTYLPKMIIIFIITWRFTDMCMQAFNVENFNGMIIPAAWNYIYMNCFEEHSFATEITCDFANEANISIHLLFHHRMRWTH